MLKPQPYKLIHLIILCLISTLAYGYNPHTLHYDDNDRLTQIDLLDIDTGTTQRTDIAYWPSFDRQQKTVTHIDTDATQTVQQNRLYTYDDIYRLSTITDQLTGNVIDYTYDNNGNTLTKTDNTQNPVVNTDYTYNPRNHLKTVTQNGQAQGDYHYNYAGTRIHHNRSSRGDITYYHDGTSVIDEHSNGQQYSHYNYAHKLTSLTTQAGTHYYHYAALGTTANLSDSNGNTHASYRTDPFGQITRQQGNSQNRNIFTGHEHDTETGLIYMKARYYDPDAARFLNQDSYLGTPDEAPSLHRYLYAYSNPTVYIDPTGNFAVTDWLAKKFQSESQAIADLEQAVYDSDDSNTVKWIKGTSLKIWGGLNDTAATLAGAADAYVDNALGILGDREILGQNSYQRNQDNLNGVTQVTEQLGKDTTNYWTQEDLSGALETTKDLATNQAKDYGNKLRQGDPEAWAGPTALAISIVTGSAANKLIPKQTAPLKSID